MDFKRANWGFEVILMLVSYLKKIGSDDFKSFSLTLTPTDMEMVGVPLPDLKDMAKKISKGNYKEFLEIDVNNIFEIEILKGHVIANITDVDEFNSYFEKFIPTIENWAVCDTFIAACDTISLDKEHYFERCKELINEDDEFLNRVGLVMLLDYFIDDEHIDKIYELLNDYKSEKYYAIMAAAWLISYLYAAYPEKTLEFMKSCNVSTDILKKAKSKIKDSHRVSDKDKDALKNVVIS